MSSESRCENQKISFIMPVSVQQTGRDCDDLLRLDLFFTSFLRFFPLSNLEAFWVAAPRDEVGMVRQHVRRHIADERWQVVPETVICPELEADPDTTIAWPKPNKGWYRQQLIKLAACELVQTPFYVTLDADVICARPFSVADLVKGDRAICGIETGADYRALYTDDFASWEIRVKEERIQFAERLFGKKRVAQNRGQYYGETPVVFAAEGLRAMARRLEAQYARAWREVLLSQLPWTEQALFFHFLEIEHLVDKYYIKGGPSAVLRLPDSLWHVPECYRHPRTLESWDVDRAFSRTGDGYFVVVQSYLGNPVSAVEKRVAPFILAD